jgi:two-component system NtrC family sensor kinase
MKLAAKLVGILLLGLVVLTGIRIYSAVSHEQSEFEQEIAAELEHIGRALERMSTGRAAEESSEVADRLDEHVIIEETAFSVRWVDPQATHGAPNFPRAPSDFIAKIDTSQRRWIVVPDAEGVRHVHGYWPVTVGGQTRKWIEFSRLASEIQQNQLSAVLRNVFVGVATAVMAVFLVAVVGVRLVGRPAQLLVEKTRRIAAGDLSGPVQLKTHDEFGELAASINDMCEQLQASQNRVQEEAEARVRAVEQLRHADRLRTVGRLGAGVAHELGTPLNVVSGRAGLIASGKLSEEDVVKSAGTIKAEADRMTAIIRKLLDFARRNTPQRSVVDLHQVARETADLLASLAKKKGIEMDVRADHPPLPASVDRGQMQQVLTNLIVNAAQALPDGGRVDIELGRTRAVPPPEAEAANAGEAEYIRIAVKDEGQGIPPEILDQVFEPFFTTKEVGEGTGLGLSIAYGIVQDHGGWIDVTSEPGQGTCFAVYLPGEASA